MSTSSSSEHSEPDQRPHPPRNEVVIGRCPRYTYWYGIFFIGFAFASGGAIYFDPQMMRDSSSRMGIAGLLFFAFVLPGLLIIWVTMRTCVIADSNGLRWRVIGRWKSATWPQVRDYYFKRVNNKRSTPFIETENGSLALDYVEHGKRIQEIVQARASWAKASKWELRDNPKNSLILTDLLTFTINPNAKREFAIICLISFLGLPLLLIVPAWHTLAEIQQSLSIWWSLGASLSLLTPCIASALLIAVLAPRYREAERRKSESITVSPEGILWYDSAINRQIMAAWKEVVDYYVAELPGWVKIDARYVVITTQGDFDFVDYKNANRLADIIQKYCAAQGLQQKWERLRERSQPLISVQGANVFNYRHREVKAMLWFVLTITGATWVSVLQRYYGLAQHHEISDILMGLFFTVPLSIGILWALWRYFSFQITTDDKGITQRNGRRAKSIPWPDVEEYELDTTYLVIRSKNQTIRCLTLIGNKKALMQIIEAQAVNSKTHGW